MSRNLATQIKDSAIPGKWKRIAEAYAAFANNDGTNIYPTRENLGKKAGCGKDTVYRQTPDLLACGLLSHAQSHTCRIENCNKGATHFTGVWGHYTVVYNLHIENLQNAETYLSAKYRKACAAKRRKVGAANCDATQALKTPASASPTLGTPDSSALTGGSKQVSEQVVLAPEELASSAPVASLEKQDQKQLVGTENQESGGGRQSKQSPQTVREMFGDYFDDAMHLLLEITPQPTDVMVRDGYPLCQKILDFFMWEFDEIRPEVRHYQRYAATGVLQWNRAHRSGRYATKEDKKLYIRSAKQFLRAMEAGNLLNDYLNHDFDQCETCKAAGVQHYETIINNIIKRREDEKRRKEDERRFREEQERIARLCARCQNTPHGKYSLPGFRELLPGGVQEVSKRVCDACYDTAYEEQRRNINTRVKYVLEPRSEYAEAKRREKEAMLAAYEAKEAARKAAEGEARKKRMEELDAMEEDVPICRGCGQVRFHAKDCPTRQQAAQAVA
jgi:hypothetical protein